MAHLPAVFDRFREIVLGDTEFIARPGELYEAVCVAFHELRSGRKGVRWCDDFDAVPPHATGPDVLFVGFTAAEPEFYGSVGWPFDMAFLDLRVVHINLANIAWAHDDPRRLRPPRSLIDILKSKGVRDGDAAFKDALRRRIMAGGPFTDEERAAIMAYCRSDVALLAKLFELLIPDISKHLGQALGFGEYVKCTAEMFVRGIASDARAETRLRRPEIRQAIRLRAVSNESLTGGLYSGTALQQAKLREFLARHRIKGWRTTASGRLGTSRRDFQSLAEQRPEFADLPDIAKTVSQLHDLQLVAGPDGRYRTPIWAFSTITSRMAPNGAAFPFTAPSWVRFTITPQRGRVLLYLDFSSMEFGVAAGLAQDATMLSDYDREPYLVLPILAGLLPPDATKQTHGAERDRYKPMILAVQYGGGAGLLAHRLDLSRSQGQRLVDLHHERYAGYWDWSDRKLQRAFDDGELVAKDGWRCTVNSRTPIYTARNWFIQTNACGLFRYATVLMMRVFGVPVCAPVHDAVLIDTTEEAVERDKARAVMCLERASQRFLGGLKLRVDVKPIRFGERFTDPRGVRTWAFVEQSLRELEEADVA
jgi:DNA polymerase-1